MKEQIIEFIKNEYVVSPEYPFSDDFETAVFRNPKNKKWFGIIMCVPLNRLKIDSDECAYILNLKNTPENVSILRGINGVYPAYHMNKENWISIILDGQAPLAMIIDLIDQSYNIVDKKTKK